MKVCWSEEHLAYRKKAPHLLSQVSFLIPQNATHLCTMFGLRTRAARQLR